MASKSKEQQSPVKRKFSSPLGNQRYVTKGISPRFKTNLKDFRSFGPGKQGKQRGDLGPSHGKPWRKPQKVTPVRFHFGGNSADPLNLNSLINRDPAIVTPQASPMSVHSESPVEVLEPRDQTDPLNLKGIVPEPENATHVTPKKRKKKKRAQNAHQDRENEIGQKEKSTVSSQQTTTFSEGKRKRKKNPAKAEELSESALKDDKAGKRFTYQCGAKPAETSDNSLKSLEEEKLEPSPKKKANISMQTPAEVDNKDNHITKMEESFAATKPDRTSGKHQDMGKCHGSNKGKESKKDQYQLPKKRKGKDKLFIYGNYNRYYGYRNPQCSQDLRLKCFNKDWFEGKDVLDLGCNVGHITLTIARDFNPQVIKGIDIDPSLIKAAKNNLRYYVQSQVSVSGTSKKGMDFPMSFSVISGPLAAPVVLGSEDKLSFPHNVVFKQVSKISHFARAYPGFHSMM